LLCLSCSGRVRFYGRRASYDSSSELRDREAIYVLFAFHIAHVVSGKWPAAGPKTPLLHARFCSAPCLTFNYKVAESNMKNRTPRPLALGGESNCRKSSDWLQRSELYTYQPTIRNEIAHCVAEKIAEMLDYYTAT
jgi:hypothetical protein